VETRVNSGRGSAALCSEFLTVMNVLLIDALLSSPDVVALGVTCFTTGVGRNLDFSSFKSIFSTKAGRDSTRGGSTGFSFCSIMSMDVAGEAEGEVPSLVCQFWYFVW